MKHKTDYYRGALFAARVEREKLVEKRARLDSLRTALEKEIQQLDQTVLGLRVLSGEEDIDKAGHTIPGLTAKLSLADACRAVLAASDRYLTPMRVRTELTGAKYPLDETKNNLAAIHGILKRFEQSGEADVLDVEGKTGYRLRRESPDEAKLETATVKSKK